MKPTIPLILLAAASSGIAFGAAATAYTTPVGYITHTINGVGTKSPAPAFANTYISATMAQPNVFAGVSNVAPSGSTVTFADASVPINLDSTCVLEITSTGWWSTVASSTSSSITVASPFPGSLPTNVQVTVRKHNTLSNFLGTNAPGLTTFDGVSPDYDEVQILSPQSDPQETRACVYVSGANWGDLVNYPNGVWMLTSDSSVANDLIVEPGTAIRIKRLGTTDLSFTSPGAVKTTPTQVDLYPKSNWIGTPLAVGKSLNAMTFNSQLHQFDGISPNYDEVQFLTAVLAPIGENPAQQAQPFAAADLGGPDGVTMYDLVNAVNAGTKVFPEGSGVVINRIGNSEGTITIPGTVVTAP